MPLVSFWHAPCALYGQKQHYSQQQKRTSYEKVHSFCHRGNGSRSAQQRSIRWYNKLQQPWLCVKLIIGRHRGTHRHRSARNQTPEQKDTTAKQEAPVQFSLVDTVVPADTLTPAKNDEPAKQDTPVKEEAPVKQETTPVE